MFHSAHIVSAAAAVEGPGSDARHEGLCVLLLFQRTGTADWYLAELDLLKGDFIVFKGHLLIIPSWLLLLLLHSHQVRCKVHSVFIDIYMFRLFSSKRMRIDRIWTFPHSVKDSKFTQWMLTDYVHFVFFILFIVSSDRNLRPLLVSISSNWTAIRVSVLFHYS